MKRTHAAKVLFFCALTIFQAKTNCSTAEIKKFLAHAADHNIAAMQKMIKINHRLIKSCDAKQQTALHHAVMNNTKEDYSKIITWLYSMRCDFNAQDADKQTALRRCFSETEIHTKYYSYRSPFLNQRALYTLIISSSCNPFLKDKDNKTIREVLEKFPNFFFCQHTAQAIKEAALVMHEYEKLYKKNCEEHLKKINALPKIEHRQRYALWHDVIIILN